MLPTNRIVIIYMMIIRPILQGFHCNDRSLSGLIMQFIVCIGFVHVMRWALHLQHREMKTAWTTRELRSSVLKMAGDRQAAADRAQVPSLQQGCKGGGSTLSQVQIDTQCKA